MQFLRNGTFRNDEDESLGQRIGVSQFDGMPRFPGIYMAIVTDSSPGSLGPPVAQLFLDPSFYANLVFKELTFSVDVFEHFQIICVFWSLTSWEYCMELEC